MFNYDKVLENLKNSIESGELTPATCVNYQTLICVIETTTLGKTYHQFFFEDIPESNKDLIYGLKKGEKVGNLKIIGIYDHWPVEKKKQEIRTITSN